jgi:hypothetical protein
MAFIGAAERSALCRRAVALILEECDGVAATPMVVSDAPPHAAGRRSTRPSRSFPQDEQRRVRDVLRRFDTDDAGVRDECWKQLPPNQLALPLLREAFPHTRRMEGVRFMGQAATRETRSDLCRVEAILALRAALWAGWRAERLGRCPQPGPSTNLRTVSQRR